MDQNHEDILKTQKYFKDKKIDTPYNHICGLPVMIEILYMYVSVGDHGGQKRSLESLEFEL